MNKEMDYWDLEDRDYYAVTEPETHVIMQYTGLKDKNGKDIYEGDIFTITTGEEETNIVEFYNGEYFLLDHGLNLSKWNNDGKVIGNIYENPELVKEK